MKYMNKATRLIGEVIKFYKNSRVYHLRFEDGSTTLVSPITLEREYMEVKDNHNEKP